MATARKPRSSSRRRKMANPRVSCGSVSAKHNRYVGGTYTKTRGKAKGHRRVVGCARVGSDASYYATRAVGAKGTRYTPVKKRALRDLRHERPKAVKVPKHRGTKRTSASLAAAFTKRYAKPARKKNPTHRKLTGAAKAEFLRRMAVGKRRAAR